MQRKKLVTAMLSLSMAMALNGCGGGSSGGDDGGGGPPPPPPAATYSVTLTAIQLDRTADQRDLVVTALPADGAVLTIP